MRFHLLKYLLPSLLSLNFSYSQEIPSVEDNFIKILDRSVKSDIIKKKSEMNDVDKYRHETQRNFVFRFYSYVQNEKTSLDLFTSINENISFGGFWDKYAVLNFTPNTFIKPVSFISLSASRNFNCFIELNNLKQKIGDIVLQGISILAIDNASKIFFKNQNWISQAVTFAAKNLLINILIKPSAVKNETPIYENYYYSVSINF